MLKVRERFQNWRDRPTRRFGFGMVGLSLLAVVAIALLAGTGAMPTVLHNIGLTGGGSPPTNDAFASADALAGADNFSGTTDSATTETGEPDISVGDQTVWYSWTPPASGMTYIVPNSAAPVPTVRVYTGSSVDALTRVDVGQGGGPDQSAAAIPAVANTTYDIQVDAASGSSGAFQFSLIQPNPGTPANDDFANATTLNEAINDAIAGTGSNPVATGTTDGATAESGEPANPVNSVWYAWSAPGGQSAGADVTLSVAATTPGDNVHLAVYGGASVGALTQVAPGAGSGPTDSVTFSPAGGTTYAIQVDGDQTYFTLSASPTNVAGPDTTAPTVSCGSAPSAWSNQNVTVPCTASDSGSGLANAADASFSLTTTVPADTTTSVAATGTHTVCDNAGNCTAAGPITGIKIDEQPPTVSCAPTPGDWQANNVTVACTASDGANGSGLADGADTAFSLTTSVPADTSTTVATFSSHGAICDHAGNCTAVPAPAPAEVDLLAPTVSCGSVPTGWQLIDATVLCTASDSGSGLADGADASFSLSTSVGDANVQAAAMTDSKQVCDLAGNCTTAGPLGPVEVDRQDPAVHCAVPNGWLKGASTTISCTASDAGSGLAVASDANFTLSATIAPGTEGQATTTSLKVCDVAGNCITEGPLTGVQLDDAPPVITCQPTPTAWQLGSASVGCVAVDHGSGLSPADQSFTLTATVPAGTESSAVTMPSKTVCDGVGNCVTTPTLAPAKIDDQTPTVTCALPPAGVHYAEVTVSCNATDGEGSGLGDPAQASFTLTTAVGAGNADSTATTNSQQVCDQAGNCIEAGPVGPIDIDRTTSPPGSAPDLSVPSVVDVLAGEPASSFTAGATGGGAVPVPFSVPQGTSDADLGVVTSCLPSPKNDFPVGLSTVVCSAEDDADRVTTKTFLVRVTAASRLAPSGPAAIGGSWTALGSGFTPGSSVTVELDGSTLDTTTASASGAVSDPVTIPATTTIGSHLLVLRGQNPLGDPELVVTPLTTKTASSSTSSTTTTTTTTTGGPPPPTGSRGAGGGYRLVASDGGLFSFGGAQYFGSMGGQPLNSPIVGMTATPGGGGYWLVASDGGIFAFGNAAFLGSMGGQPLNSPIVGMAATPDGGGYWLVASDGGIFAFGDAPYYGSMGGQHLNSPVVAMAAPADGGGYWLAAADGGVFAFGDAQFHGSAGGRRFNAPVVAMGATADAAGYWLVAADGGVFAFGDAPYHGSAAATRVNAHIVSMAPTPDDGGYWLASADGGVFAFGDAPYNGSMGGQTLNRPIVGLTATHEFAGFLRHGHVVASTKRDQGGAAVHSAPAIVSTSRPHSGPPSDPTTNERGSSSAITGQNGAVGSKTANGTETFGGGAPPKRDGRQPLPVYHLPKGETLGTLAGPSGGVATWVWAAGALFVLALLAAGFVVVTKRRRSPVPSIDVDGD